ncbi:zf-HC2 domain-containing protein [Streptomyces sp. NPDC004647]|uniref:anti-sigma factor family protein n=1 Tax=Streptomyces sp. NPDC004647 TaxID=3154671 RepID=UPI0033AFF6B7
MTGFGGTSHAEQHLGDRLAALVDGELGHDTRERVLAHLATCWTCKAEADAQRRLKSVFAETAPPPPSEGLLARLQGLPGGDGGQESPFGSGNGGVFGMRPEAFAYVPSGGHGARGGQRGGFPIHDVERNSSRSRRFAFAAAGAVSLAAFALGGALPLEAAIDSVPGRKDGAGAAATPVRTAQASGVLPVSGGDAMLAASAAGSRPFLFAAPTGAGSPSFPTATGHPPAQPRPPLHPFTSPMLPTATVLTPLIRETAYGPRATAFGEATVGTTQPPAPTRVSEPSAPHHQAAPLVGANAAPDPSASAER